MLEFLRRKASDRKLRLFACACGRRICDRFPDPGNRDLVATVEDHPDGCFQDPALEAALIASSRREHEFRGAPAYWAAKYLGRGFYKTTAAVSAFVVAARVVFMADDRASREAEAILQFAIRDAMYDIFPFRLPAPLPPAAAAEAAILAGLLRDVFGNPFRPVGQLPAAVLAWNGRTVQRLAQAAYDERNLPAGTLDPDRLAVLADALDDAGCTDADLLGHLRGPAPHVRGCVAVDAILDFARQ
jgi:hypothetical protein